jgi:hypothetical protein
VFFASFSFRCFWLEVAPSGHHEEVRTVALSALAAVAACLLTAPAAFAVNPATATLTLSSNAAGAKPVVATIVLRETELQCGRLVGGSLVVTFPRAMCVPRTIGAASVLVGTKAARSVTVAGRVVTVGVPVPRGVLCDSIAIGVVKIAFARAAGLGNPKAPGAYLFTVRRGSETFGSPFRIH